MIPEPPSAIIITDGGLPALVAAAIEAERAIVEGQDDRHSTAMMVWPSGPRVAVAQHSAAVSQSRFFRLGVVETPRLCADGFESETGLLDTLCLLAAVEAARASGCRRVVWPVQFPSDDASLTGHLDAMATAVDRALLAGRLSLLDGGDEITIETPLVDLTSRQVGDLVVDLDAPAYLSWWWRRQPDAEAENIARGVRRGWLDALGEVGWVQTGPGATVMSDAGSAPKAQ